MYTQRYSHLPQLYNSFVKSINSHFNDFDIISIQTKTLKLIDHKNNKLIEDNIISAYVTSVQIKGNKWNGFYMNNIMFDNANLTLNTKNNILLHHLFHYISHLDIKHGLFKYKILPRVTPFCKFNTYEFPVSKWRQPPHQSLHHQFKLFPLSKQNFHLFTNFMKTFGSIFNTFFHTNTEQILHLIVNSFWFVDMLVIDDNVIAIFFFKIKRKSVLHCFASVNKCTNIDDFILAFKMSFWNIANKNNCNLASIDSLSHNNPIINNIKTKTHPSTVTPYAFYYYNFKHSFSVPNSDCLFIL
jgi:hypothetical protein